MQTALRRKTETGNEKDPSAALGMTKRERHISHSFSLRYGSQPPALRATSFQRKEGECPFPRNVISSESEKSFSFAMDQEKWEQRITGSTVHQASRDHCASCEGSRSRIIIARLDFWLFLPKAQFPCYNG